MLLPDLHAQPKRGRTALFIVLAVLAAALVAGYRPLKQQSKIWRSQTLATSAEAFATANQWTEAEAQAQAALQLNPKEIRALRVMAKVLTHARKDDAFNYWGLVWAEQPPTADERHQVIDLALHFRKLDLAETYLNEALTNPPVALDTYRQAAVFCDARNNHPGAINFARRYFQGNGTNDDLKLILARALIAGGKPAEVVEAKSLLWPLISTNQMITAAAVIQLAGLPDLTREEIETCLTEFSRLPLKGVRKDLLVTDLRLRLAPTLRSNLVAQLVSQYQHSPPDDLKNLADWLNKHGEYSRVLELVSVYEAMARGDLLAFYADALSGLGRWTELEALFAHDNLPLDPMYIEMFRARTAVALGKQGEADLHWTEALGKAGARPEFLKRLAVNAEGMGADALATKAYSAMTRIESSRREGYLGMVQLLERNKDTRGLRKLMEELAGLYPTDPAPRNDLAYLKLLLREDISGAKAVAEQLVQQNANLMSYRTTLALAFLRQNDPRGATNVYSTGVFNWSQSLPGWQAVMCAAMGSAGDTNNALFWSNRIPLDRLKPEERELIQPWL